MPKALDGIGTLLVDMDGVLYRGETPIKGSARAINELRRRGKKLVFITNNSASSRAAYVRKLRRMGIKTEKSEIMTSGYATALFIKKNLPQSVIYFIGEKGLKQELEEAGLRTVGAAQAERATHVVASFDRKLDYRKISAGLHALLRGAEFIATNSDATYPTERGLSPGAGTTIGALKGCSEREPRIVIGKPSPVMVELAMRKAGAKRKNTAIVGDRLNTDVAAGKKSGIRTILLLSGISSRKDAQKSKGTRYAPDFVHDDLEEVVFG